MERFAFKDPVSLLHCHHIATSERTQNQLEHAPKSCQVTHPSLHFSFHQKIKN